MKNPTENWTSTKGARIGTFVGEETIFIWTRTNTILISNWCETSSFFTDESRPTNESRLTV